MNGLLPRRMFGGHGAAAALNDCPAGLPAADFGRYGVLPALKRDGRRMPVRGKGPLITRPSDSFPGLKARTFHSRPAWRLAQPVAG